MSIIAGQVCHYSSDEFEQLRLQKAPCSDMLLQLASQLHIFEFCDSCLQLRNVLYWPVYRSFPVTG